LATDSETAIWQLACWPSWPQYWCDTPTECAPAFWEARVVDDPGFDRPVPLDLRQHQIAHLAEVEGKKLPFGSAEMVAVRHQREAANHLYRDYANAVLARIIGARHDKLPASPDDFLTLAIIAYHGRLMHDNANRAIMVSILQAGGILSPKGGGLRPARGRPANADMSEIRRAVRTHKTFWSNW
jgi:hypothetical protein